MIGLTRTVVTIRESCGKCCKKLCIVTMYPVGSPHQSGKSWVD